jgi:hypothetical protein
MVHRLRAQAAIDFLTTYGIALLIIFIASAVIYNISVVRPALATSTCTAAPGFACESYALNTNGVLSLTLSQATGGAITILGAACSSLPSASGNKPAYGNFNVINSIVYYTTNNAPGLGINVYSGESNTMYMYCYGPNGVATGNLGTGYDGFVWLNYTIPTYGNVVQQVAIISLRYT